MLLYDKARHRVKTLEYKKIGQNWSKRKMVKIGQKEKWSKLFKKKIGQNWSKRKLVKIGQKEKWSKLVKKKNGQNWSKRKMVKILTLVHIFGEPVDDSSCRRGVEEGHGREEDPLEHGVVQLRRARQEPDGQRHGLQDAEDQQQDHAHAVDQLKRRSSSLRASIWENTQLIFVY
jgi:hypothetical protein